eukprot:CAMPEP_0115539950 /NCGR_PEP_ID=MMETSP0271-20121206/89672_1 /TAXON_ID=71861 /ORGANISM="Scrippsiella trochoidea, Strain CCMP3099" /LENGTH=54 /DNA_ID=CAMNT_0002972921 /DNA_START=445 /DNA_END=606 /DNA_ORIENTATION=+
MTTLKKRKLSGTASLALATPCHREPAGVTTLTMVTPTAGMSARWTSTALAAAVW